MEVKIDIEKKRKGERVEGKRRERGRKGKEEERTGTLQQSMSLCFIKNRGEPVSGATIDELSQ